MKKPTLTLQQKLFCKYYTQNSETRGNGTLSYAEAYSFMLETLSTVRNKVDGKEVVGTSEYEKKYAIASTKAYLLLRKEQIQKYIRICLNQMLTTTVVDSELTKVVLQDSDMPSKVAAIREFNKLKQRITEKQDITSNGLPINLTTYQPPAKK